MQLPSLPPHNRLLHLWVWTAFSHPGKHGEKLPTLLSIDIRREKQLRGASVHHHLARSSSAATSPAVTRAANAHVQAVGKDVGQQRSSEAFCSHSPHLAAQG